MSEKIYEVDVIEPRYSENLKTYQSANSVYEYVDYNGSCLMTLPAYIKQQSEMLS